MKISVLTPSFNTAKYLQRAIDSVKSQSYANWEHIVVDGGSSDETLDILINNQHLKWISEPDAGQSDAMNKAFDMSTGSIIVYLNADDYFHRDAFTAAITTFKDNIQASFVIGNLERITVNPKSGEIIEQDVIVPEYTYKHIVHEYRGRHFPYNPVCYFYKRDIQERVGSFPTNNHFAMDLYFLLRALQFAPAIKINRTLGTFWTDGRNKTSKSKCTAINRLTVLEHLKKFNKSGYLMYLIKRWNYFRVRPLFIKTKVFFYPVYKLACGRG